MSNLCNLFPVDPRGSGGLCADFGLANPKWKALPSCVIPLLTPSQSISVHKLRSLQKDISPPVHCRLTRIMWFSGPSWGATVRWTLPSQSFALNSDWVMFFNVLLAWYFLSPAVRKRVVPAMTADTAEWRSTECGTVIILANGLKVAPCSTGAAFT